MYLAWYILKYIYVFTDDPFIPKEEFRHIAEHLGTEYTETNTDGHFMEKTFPSLVELVLSKIKASKWSRCIIFISQKNEQIGILNVRI